MPVFDRKKQIIYLSSSYLSLNPEHIAALPYVLSPSGNKNFFYFSKNGQRVKFQTWDELKEIYQREDIFLKNFQELKSSEKIKEISWNVFETASGKLFHAPAGRVVSLTNLFSGTETSESQLKSVKPSVSSLNKTVFEDHLGNKFPTKKAMALYYGITPVVLAKRQSRGWSLEKALTTPINPQLPTVKDHLGNTFVGKKELYKHYDVVPRIAEKLLAAGFSLEDVLTKKEGVYNTGRVQKDHLGNVFIGLKTMCEHYGITTSAYYQRLRAGWTLEETLTTPIGDHTKKGIACKDHLGNEFSSIGDMLDHYGITRTVYGYRKKLGWTLEKILTTPFKVQDEIKDHLGNEYETVHDMASKYPCKTSETYRSRRKTGMSVEKALMTPVAKRDYQKSRECFDYLGDRYETLKAMCDHYEIEPNTYKARRRRGMSVEEALTTPVERRKRKVGKK